MTATTPAFAHLFVLLAREAPVGVIFRRGPREWTQLIHWKIDKDIFTPGQWFRGQIYLDRCDISPDGTYLIYFAAKHWRKKDSVWTAVSKPPYFTALKIWFQVGTYGGGGVFADNHHVWLHSFHAAGNYQTLSSEPNDKQPPDAGQMFQHKTAFHLRLARDGWKLAAPDAKTVIWRKQVGKQVLCLEELPYRSGSGSVYRYSLMNEQSREMSLEGVNWADFDQRKRLVLAKEGKLFSAAVVDGELVYTELADFNANQPEAIESPDWAKKW
jgi:hypothetical protein